MRLAILILPLALAAAPVAAEHDRHHKSIPRVTGQVRLEPAPAAKPRPEAEMQAVSLSAGQPKAERARVRVVLPSPFAQ